MTEKKTPRRSGDGWFDRLPDLKKDLVCAGFLLLIVFGLFRGVVWSDKTLASTGGDYMATHNWMNAIKHIEETQGVAPLWIPYVYGGMPVASTLLFPDDYNWIEGLLSGGIALKKWTISVADVLFGPGDVKYFLLHVFLGGLFSYMLARALRLPHLGALLVGCVFLLNPYAIGLGESFHWSKLAVFSYIPLLFLLVHRLMEKRDVLTFGLLAATIGTMFLNRHPQIAFYGMLLVGCYFLYEFIADIRKEPKRYVTAGALLVVAIGLGLAIYSYEMLPTKEYAEYSVRGGGGEGAQGGASYDWATNWSLHPLELMNYIVPSWFGFSSQVAINWKGQEAVLPAYWGWMPMTDNPPYIGIVPVVLALIALAYRRNRMTWFLAGFSVFVFFLSFGRYLPVVYDLFYHYFPYFNKFRAPSLVLFLIPLTVGLLGVYGLSWIVDTGRQPRGSPGGEPPARKFQYAMAAAAAVFVLALVGKDALFGMFPPTAFTKEGDPFNTQTMPIVREIRFELLWRDLLKVSAIVAMLFGLVVVYFRRTIGASAMSMGVVLLLVGDLVVVNQNFIHPRDKADLILALRPDATMKFFEKDTTVYRVLALEQNLFRDNTLMSHTVQSVTGYSPAKLKIYQELLDSALMRSSDSVMPVNMNVVSMMNTKYLITPTPLPPDRFRQSNYDPQKKLFVHFYPKALQRAWFVDTAITVASKSEMYAAINAPDWKPNETAILNDPVPPEIGRQDSSWVRLEKYGAHEIVLKAYTSHAALMVLSEIYYPAGWTASIDGAETKILRTNAVLRSVVVPAGDHEVKFTFDPDSYRTGSMLSTAGWAVVFLTIGIGAWRDERVRGLLKKKG
jgi:hypothetical protein